MTSAPGSAARRFDRVSPPETANSAGKQAERSAARGSSGETGTAPAVVRGGIRPPRRKKSGQAPKIAKPDLSDAPQSASIGDRGPALARGNREAVGSKGDKASSADAAGLDRVMAGMRWIGPADDKPDATGKSRADDDKARTPDAPGQPSSRKSPSPAAPPRGTAKRKAAQTKRIDTAPPLKVKRRGAHGMPLKSAMLISALILLAAIGAGMTVRALTARSDASATADARLMPPSTDAATIAGASKPALAAQATAMPAAMLGGVAPSVDANSARPVRAAVDTRAAVAGSVPAASSQSALKPPIDAAANSPSPAESTASTPASVAVAAAAPSDAATKSENTALSAKPAASAKAGPAAGQGLPAGSAKVRSGVTLRSSPNKGASVIGHLNAGETIEIVSCKYWCEIVAGGRRGYVFQKFLAPASGGPG